MKTDIEVDTCGLERFSAVPYWIFLKVRICGLIKECISVM